MHGMENGKFTNLCHFLKGLYVIVPLISISYRLTLCVTDRANQFWYNASKLCPRSAKFRITAATLAIPTEVSGAPGDCRDGSWHSYVWNCC